MAEIKIVRIMIEKNAATSFPLTDILLITGIEDRPYNH